MPAEDLLPELEKRLLDIKVKLASNDKAAEAGATLSGTVQDEISEHYLRVYQELNQLSHYIDDAKVQTSALCPDDIRNASDERVRRFIQGKASPEDLMALHRE